MKIYSCTFNGHWPVGAAAIIVAPDKDAAKALMKAALKEQGLDVKNPDLELVEVDKKTMAVFLISRPFTSYSMEITNVHT